MSRVARFVYGTTLNQLPTSVSRQEMSTFISSFTVFKYPSRRVLWKDGVNSFLRINHFSPIEKKKNTIHTISKMCKLSKKESKEILAIYIEDT